MFGKMIEIYNYNCLLLTDPFNTVIMYTSALKPFKQIQCLGFLKCLDLEIINRQFWHFIQNKI